MDKKFIENMLTNAEITYKCGHMLGKLTTFRIGGPCDFFVKVSNMDQLSAVLTIAGKTDMEYFIIGAGSNVLISDKGFNGMVIKLTGDFTNMIFKNERVHAGAGCMLMTLSSEATSKSLSGLEFASGIPGTVGGALVMNAGAYGSEIFNIVQKVNVWNTMSNSFEEHGLPIEHGYRTSRYMDMNEKKRKYMVLSTELLLKSDDHEKIRARVKELTERRKKSQPWDKKSAGSVFKKPASEKRAHELICEAGLSGYRIGDAMVSKKHANFIINAGKAKAKDVHGLIFHIKAEVKKKFNVELESEIQFMGEQD